MGPMDSDAALFAQLPHTLTTTHLKALGTRYEGKVRDTYAKGDSLFLVVTDRLSAFDRVLTTIPFKGEVLNRLSAFWFERTRHVVKNHFLDLPDPNVTVARACVPLQVEVIVRGYLAGSLWRDVRDGNALPWDLPLPEAPREHQAFERPIVTPFTKAAVGEHDQPIGEAALQAQGLVSPRHWAQIREAALALYEEGRRWAASRGLILVDTKYEFGLLNDEVILIDEIHTPDSSRYWLAESLEARLARGEPPEMFDKETIRRWLISEHGFQGHGELPTIPDPLRVELARRYLSVYEALTGVVLPTPVAPVAQRMETNLRAAGLL